MARLGWSDLSPLGQAGIISQGFGAVSGAVGSFYAASAEKYKTKSLALSLQHKKDMALFNMRQKESQAQHLNRMFNKRYQIMTLKQGRAKSKNIVSEQEEKDTYENYEPDWKDLQAHEEALAEWKKNNPDWSDEDAASYYGQIQSDIERGK